MTLRLGFVGCGKWARKLAESFRACGAEVVAYDRRSSGQPPPEHAAHGPGVYWSTCNRCELDKFGGWGYPPNVIPAGGPDPVGFGKRMPWRDQLASKDIDAIIAVAPPEITTQVALECARQGKAVMATKPLFDHPETIRAPFYVDFWRLWSEAHAELRDRAGAGHMVYLELHGAGPVRSFHGVFDYGPHVMAAALDLFSALPSPRVVVTHEYAGGETLEVELNDRCVGFFGNGSRFPVRAVRTNGWHAEETPTHIGTEPKDEVIQKMCRTFLSDVSEGFVDTRLLSLSREGMRLLNEIRAGAT